MFSGRSRENKLSLTRDTTRGRDESLAQLRRAREKREAETKRQTCATKVQKVFRSYSARKTMNHGFCQRMTSGDMSVPQMTTFLHLLRPQSERASHVEKLVASFLLAPAAPKQLSESPFLVGQFLKFTVAHIIEQGRDTPLPPFVDELLPPLLSLLKNTPLETRALHQLVIAKLVRFLVRTQEDGIEHPTRCRNAANLLHAVMLDNEENLNRQVDLRALQMMASGTPIGSIMNRGQSRSESRSSPTFSSLLIWWPGFKSAEDNDMFEATALEALSTTTTPANAGVYFRLVLSSFSWQGVWASPQPLPTLLSKLSALLRLLDACGTAALATAMIEALGQQSSHEDPLRALYSTDALGSFARLATILSNPAESPEAIRMALEASNMLAGLFIRPWLAYATTPETKRKALSLISKVSHSRGVLRALFAIGHTHVSKWAQKDGRGCLIVAYPSIMVLFSYALVHFIDTTDFAYSMKQSLSDDSLTQENIRAVVNMLRNLVFRSHMQGCALDDGTRAFARASHTLLSRLHVVDEAHSFMPGAEWLAPAGGYPQALSAEEWADGVTAEDNVVDESSADDEEDDDSDGIIGRGTLQYQAANRRRKPAKEFDPSQSVATRTVQLLQHTPFLIPFTNRVTYFSALMYSSDDLARQYWGDDDVVVDRGDVFNTAFLKLRNLTAEQLLAKTRVRFRSATGQLEEGFGDGVYRDFVTSICAEGFSPSTGLFEKTAEGFVYPRAFTDKLVGADHLERFQFLGRMLGKALRQGILLDVPFAPFFRNLLLGRTNGINELPSLDAEMHRHLLSLRDTPADQFEYLDLTFTTTQDCLGAISEVPLVRGGENLPVTASNVMPYIHLVADYKLNRLAKRQCDAFRRGLEELVNPKWLRFFDSNELQLLFQGREDEIGLDVADWRANTHYSGQAAADHPSVLLFWQVVEGMTPQEQRKLLKFTTSVSRAPLLGFRHLAPQFNIHLYADGDRLPSAATCMCMLKLPAYGSFNKMREKLLTAIESNTFDMS